MIDNVAHAQQLQIIRLKNLPALPDASLKILQAINNPDIEIEQLVKVLGLSPSLTARLIGLANSAYFNQSRTINDLHTAIVQVLGLQLVKSLALGVVLNVQLDVKKCKNFDNHGFWCYSLMVAACAQRLAAISGFEGQSGGTVYTSGLLLNIGLLVMAFVFPDDLESVLKLKPGDFIQLGDLIKQEIGLSHFQVGYLLLNKWQLPEIFQSSLHRFETLDCPDSTVNLPCILKTSQILCNALVAEIDCESFESIAEATGLMPEPIAQVYTEMAENRNNIECLAMALAC